MTRNLMSIGSKCNVRNPCYCQYHDGTQWSVRRSRGQRSKIGRIFRVEPFERASSCPETPREPKLVTLYHTSEHQPSFIEAKSFSPPKSWPILLRQMAIGNRYPDRNGDLAPTSEISKNEHGWSQVEDLILKTRSLAKVLPHLRVTNPV